MVPVAEDGNGNVKHSWYQTTFTLPSDWEDDNLIINFGAVDNEATVFVNVSIKTWQLGSP